MRLEMSVSYAKMSLCGNNVVILQYKYQIIEGYCYIQQ